MRIPPPLLPLHLRGIARRCQTEFAGVGGVGGHWTEFEGRLGTGFHAVRKQKPVHVCHIYNETNYLLSSRLRTLVLHKKHKYDCKFKSNLTLPGRHEIIPWLVRSFCLCHSGLNIEQSESSNGSLEIVLYEETSFLQSGEIPSCWLIFGV